MWRLCVRLCSGVAWVCGGLYHGRCGKSPCISRLERRVVVLLSSLLASSRSCPLPSSPPPPALSSAQRSEFRVILVLVLILCRAASKAHDVLCDQLREHAPSTLACLRADLRLDLCRGLLQRGRGLLASPPWNTTTWQLRVCAATVCSQPSTSTR